MDRKEFLSLLGLGAAAVAIDFCLGGCQGNASIPTAPTNVDFTLNLNDQSNSALKSNGGYIYNNNVIVARTVNGTYIAVSAICTHQGATVFYNLNSNRFYCPSHGSNFATDGSVINGPAGSPLVKYNTSSAGNNLRVYS